MSQVIVNNGVIINNGNQTAEFSNVNGEEKGIFILHLIKKQLEIAAFLGKCKRRDLFIK